MAIQSDHEFAPTQIARAVFPTAFRGYDQDAVRRYLSRLAAALEHQQEYAGLGELEARTPAHERVEELEAELDDLRNEIKDLELELVQRSVEGGSEGDEAGSSAVADSVPFDEHRAIELLGQETARVLESARSAAADILKRAETQAASLKAQAKSELAEARKRSKTIVADRMAESEEQAARMADEAQSDAERLRSEAEEHRSAVMEETSKILAEAEQLAEVEQAQSEERAKQIVADAETLRQQVISELVTEQRQSKAEMDRMTAARDRLAMSLAVARSELDEVADALVDASTIDSDASGGGPVVTDLPPVEEPTHEEQVNSLVEELEAKQATSDKKRGRVKSTGNAKPAAKKKRGKRAPKSGGSGASASNLGTGPTGRTDTSPTVEGDDEQSLFDGSDDTPIKTGSALFADTADGSDHTSSTATDPDGGPSTGDGPDAGNDGGSSTGNRTRGSRKGQGRKREKVRAQNETRRKDQDEDDDVTLDLAVGGGSGEPDEASFAGGAVEDPDRDSDRDVGHDSDHDVDHDGQPVVDLDSSVDLDESIDLDDTVEVIDLGSEINRPPLKGQELSLVEGFTTIELSDSDLSDDDTSGPGTARPRGGAGTDDEAIDIRDTEPGGETVEPLLPAVVGAVGQQPEELITTVSSRSATAQRDRTRGDLLIDEPFTGRLAPEFSARDVALTRSGPNFRRQLRRALNDDQSDVLDRLRAGRGDIKVDELPPFADQIDRYLAPLRRGLAEIAQAGAKAGGKGDLSQTALDNLVRQLAKYIVDKVRMPTIDVVQQTTDHDRERILEPIRALYRDFRNVGLSDLTEDALYEAFAIGLYDSIEPSVPISWVVDPRSDPDPVCEINSQRDDVVKGVVFPSGHARPLSLPGCRCLVMAEG